MPDDVANALTEIASLLRRRVEQTDESVQRSIEQIAKMEARHPAPSPAALKRMEETDARMARSHIDIEKSMAETRAFQSRLLAALDRQNELIDVLIGRLKT